VEPRKIPRRGRRPREIAGPRHDFAVTLSDERRVVGRALEGDWSVYVVVVGLILMVLGSMGRAVGGRRHYY
jgi:hypothetical protein